MSDEIAANGHDAGLKAMVNGLTTRLEPLGAEALRSGLSAFITPSQPVEIEAVPLEMIRFSRYTFRYSHSDPGLEALSEAMKQHGFVGALVGRRKGSMVEVAFGERRVRAAELAGLSTIPVQIRDLEDSAMFELALEENFLYAKLNALEKALLFKKMLNEGGYTVEAIAQRCARPVEYVNKHLLLVKYPEIEEMLRAGRIESATARALAKIDDQVMRAKMLRQALALGPDESIPARFIVTTVGLEPAVASEAQPEEQSEVPTQLWNGKRKAKKNATKKKPSVDLEDQYNALETLVNDFITELANQGLSALSQDDGWRKKSRKLLRSLEDELDDKLRELKS
jgi:ParB/RepB/Spo0J family partition protein